MLPGAADYGQELRTSRKVGSSEASVIHFKLTYYRRRPLTTPKPPDVYWFAPRGVPCLRRDVTSQS